jgi:hypothetical protein
MAACLDCQNKAAPQPSAADPMDIARASGSRPHAALRDEEIAFRDDDGGGSGGGLLMQPAAVSGQPSKLGQALQAFAVATAAVPVQP